MSWRKTFVSSGVVKGNTIELQDSHPYTEGEKVSVQITEDEDFTLTQGEFTFALNIANKVPEILFGRSALS